MIEPLPPGSTIGIVGTGQLGRMLALAAAKLGFRVWVFGPDAAPPAADVALGHVRAEYDDANALARFAEKIDVATYEFENIPPLTVHTLEGFGAAVRPNARVLAVCQDRLDEKLFFRSQGIVTAPFAEIGSAAQLAPAIAQIPGHAILKTRRLGYDGKGQVRVRPGDDIAAAWGAVGAVPSILEGFVAFDAEVSQIVARGVDGAVQFFDVPRNEHRSGILHQSHVPNGLPSLVAEEAARLAQLVVDKLDYVGVLTVEFFWSDAAGLIANEMAPRVHNSGHWTVEACQHNQFDLHIRAVAGWPLPTPQRHSNAVMTNLIGHDIAKWGDLSRDPSCSLTLYGKTDPRAGRKMGHTVRLCGPA